MRIPNYDFSFPLLPNRKPTIASPETSDVDVNIFSFIPFMGKVRVLGSEFVVVESVRGFADDMSGSDFVQKGK